MINKEILINRLKYRLMIVGYSIVLIFIFVVSGFYYFKCYIKNLSEQNNLCDSNQAIVVITGGVGRIQAGMVLLNRGCGKTLLISGVSSTFSKSYLKKSTPINKVFLGYEANNTEGNAKEALVFLVMHEIEKVLLVTNDYHMPRAKFLFENFMLSKNIRIYVVKSDEDLLIELIEYIKFIGTYVIYKFEAINKSYITYLYSIISFWKNL
ncbi:MAG: YdcF family protein [Candidatus Midichloria sp.]|nr:MAG: YdcF family protein [Candidatus Midichloria sp.]